MTTMGGRSAQYVPGREPVNKEPSVSKFVVEKLYKVHRERVLTMEPIVDCYVHVPEFLKGGQEWKKNAERTRVNRILKENQNIYKRIEKVDKEEGYFTKESRVHVKRVESKLKYLRKLKDHGRVVDILKRQKENEHFLKRIENAVPQYSKKKMKEWYKHHQHFKEGRRFDPTAGHIMHGMKKSLIPPSLPPLSQQASIANSSIVRSFNSVSASNATDNRERMVDAMSMQSFNSQTVLSYDRSVSDHPRYVLEEKSPKHKLINTAPAAVTSDDMSYANSSYISEASVTSAHSQHSRFKKKEVNVKDVIDSLSTGDYSTNTDQWEAESVGSARDEKKISGDGLIFLAQAQFPISIDTKNCHVQVFLAKEYDENLYLKVISTGFTPHTYVQRTVDIDLVYEMIGSASANLKNLGTDLDLKQLTEMLLQLFIETDIDKTGSLSYTEFQFLMEKIDLGISPQELNFVICEADEDENGAVDYNEFIPLAVDLIQSFRARNRARMISNQEDQLTDEHIMKSMPLKEIELIAETCLSKLSDLDPKGYGIIKATDLKKALSSIGYMVGLKDREINMLLKILPKDQFDRIKYNSSGLTFKDAFSQARFMTIKAALLESRSSGLEKRLLDACKKEEEKNAEELISATGIFEPSGMLPLRSLINILSNTSSLALSRMQVMVLIADATVVDNLIDYVNFIPVVSKAIELMFEPKTIKMRAELIEQTDLSTEALLDGLTTEQFEEKLRTIFKSYDVDSSGAIDFEEFVSCMEALELHLSYNEICTLFDTADEDHSGTLQFDEFVEFFTHNLLNLQREKHLRLLQSSIHELAVGDPDDANENDEVAKNEALAIFSTEITALFKMFDRNHSGLISYKDFQSVLASVSMKFSSYLMDILKAEIHADSNGMVDYASTINTCTELAKVMVAKELADDDHSAKMKWADDKSTKILTEQKDEIDHIVTYLMIKLKIVSDREDITSDAFRFHEMERVLNDPHSGLSHSESHLLISKLFHLTEKELTDIEHSVEDAIKHDEEANHDDSNGPLKKLNTAENLFVHNAKERQERNSPERNSPKTLIRRASNLHSDSDHIEFKLHLSSNRKGDVKSSFTKDELYRLVFEVRKLSIIRRLMSQVESTEIKKRLLTLLHEEKAALVAKGEMDESSNELPISVCFKLLENTREFLLSRANIIFIISSVENHEGSTISIDFFAEHSSGIIDKLHAAATQTVRAGVVSKTKISDKKVLNGWRLKDLESHLTDAFHAASNDEGEILSEMKFWHIIKSIPRLKLSDLEATTITSSFSNHMKWTDAAHPTVNAIRQLCREKFISRRIELLGTVHEEIDDNDKSKRFMEDSMASLVNIAKRLLTVVKVSVQGENVILNLPTDDTKHVVVSAYRKEDDEEEEEEEEVHEEGKEAHCLFKGDVVIPFLTLEKSMKKPINKKGKKEDASKKDKEEEFEWSVKKETVNVNMKIVAIEDIVMFSGVTLIADIRSLDGNISVTNPLNVRLPSVVMMDRDSAELFIENLVQTIFVEINGENITVKVEGD